MQTDNDLLGAYALDGNEDAFRQLVQQRINLVYSAALREAGGDTAQAQDITQAVFTELAQKSKSLVRHPALSGWLYTCVHWTAANLRRSEQRRQRREQEAWTMNERQSSPDNFWPQVQPVLDDVMHELNEKDRTAVVLRFFEGRSLKEVGEALELNENAARMRVDRALDKMRELLARRGIKSTAATMGAALAAGAVMTAPSALAAQVAGEALTVSGGAVMGGFSKTGSLLIKISGMCLALAIAVSSLIWWRTTKVTSRLQQKTNSLPAPVVQPAAQPPITSSNKLATSARSAGKTIHFQFLDQETGKPLAGVMLRAIYFSNDGESKLVRKTSDPAGKADVDVPKKPFDFFNLFVTSDGHVPKTARWDASESLPPDYTMKLDRGVSVNGTVVNEAGEPVAGAKLEFQGPGIHDTARENVEFGPDTTLLTDDRGHWSCNMLPKGAEQPSVRVTHRDYATTVAPAAENWPETGLPLIRLIRGFTVTGTIEDFAGRPVFGGTIRQIDGEQRSAKTDNTGAFVLHHVNEGELMLSVQAQGCASFVKTWNLSNDLTGLRLKMKLGHILVGKVVDEKGRPIARARVETDSDTEGMRKVRWSTTTDAAGRFEWDAAPEVPLLYRVEARGFSGTRMHSLAADGREKIIKLSHKKTVPTAEVKGMVTDADTGGPIAEFQVLWANVVPEGDPISVPDYSFATEGRKGQFHFTADSGRLRESYQLKIEADGYLPTVSSNLAIGSKRQTVNFTLQKGSGPAGVVLLPNGEPAAEATVFFYERQGGVYMDQPGEFRKDSGITITNRVQTDAAGRFSFGPKLDARGLLAIHELGYADISIATFKITGTIPLQAWGRVEGRLMIGRNPGVNQNITLNNMSYRYGETGRLYPALQLWLEATTDEAGNFIFAKVPPGERKIDWRVSKPGLGLYRYAQGFPLVIQPGTVTHVQLGGRGRPVTGQAVLPSDLENVAWEKTPVTLELKLIGEPGPQPKQEDFSSNDLFVKSLKKFGAEHQAFWQSEKGHELERSRRVYTAYCRTNGSFYVPDVPPGTYQLSIEAPVAKPDETRPYRGTRGFDSPVASLTREIVVPESDDTQSEMPVSAGICQLTATAKK